MTTVTHIVPLFPPVIDGVGDYSLNLARALRSEHSIDSRFIVTDPIWKGPGEIDDFAVAGPTSFSSNALVEDLGRDQCVILHYVGYGYHRKGIPTWLVDAIERWCRGRSQTRLIIIFHEIWSNGPPWRSAFYLAPIQKRLVARLLRASAHAFTNALWAWRKLDRTRPSGATFLPVSANIQPTGEPAAHPRGSELFQPLIFGQEWTRVRAVQKHESLLRAFQQQNLIERALVMGKGAHLDPPSRDVAILKSILPVEKISVLGEKNAAEAAEIFDRADFLLCPIRPRDLCKSSSVMSAFACGCPVVVAPPHESESPDPLRPQHFVAITDSECQLRDLASFSLRKWNLQRVAIQARAWFQENAAWPVIAARIAEKISAMPVKRASVEK